MENLQLSLKNLRHDRDSINEILLYPLDRELKDTLEKNGAVPLCQQTRRYRMEKLLDVLNQVVLSMDNFTADDEMLEQIPEELLSDVTHQIVQSTKKLHHYCKKDLITYRPTKILADNKGKEEEIHISKIHELIQKVLETLKSTGTRLQHEVPVLNQEKDSRAVEDAISSSGVNSVKSTISGMSGNRRQSFIGSKQLTIVGNNGQVDVSNAMLVDSLMMQMPLEYINKEF